MGRRAAYRRASSPGKFVFFFNILNQIVNIADFFSGYESLAFVWETNVQTPFQFYYVLFIALSIALAKIGGKDSLRAISYMVRKVAGVFI